MDTNKLAGIISVIIGLIFIVFPMFSSELVSVVVGLSLLFFGIICVITGVEIRRTFDGFSKVQFIIGIIAIIFGFLFIFYIDALSFLIGIQCYVIGIIMILFGLSGIILGLPLISKSTSALILIMGILAFCVAVFAQSNPLYIAIILGLCLIIEGISLLLHDKN